MRTATPTSSNNSATNRWTGPLAINREKQRVFLTPTSDKFKDVRSLVAPLDPGGDRCAADWSVRRDLAVLRDCVREALASRGAAPRLPSPSRRRR